MDQEHPIRVVARRTGLTAHVIRVWEKRYGAVRPRRSATNRRFYTDEDIGRLLMLRRATSSGRTIGQVATLSMDQLRELVRTDESATVGEAVPAGMQCDSLLDHVELCVAAVEALDAGALDATLSRAAVSLSRPVFLERFLSELMGRVGDSWRDGTLRVVHEHLVSSVLRTFLGGMSSGYPMGGYAPALVVGTPCGQLHELGALAAAVTAASEGWRVLYLGPSLPVEEIAAAARANSARAVLLSIMYPSDDVRIEDEMSRLRKCLDTPVQIITGGRAVAGYRQALEAAGAVILNDLTSLRLHLESLRSRPPS